MARFSVCITTGNSVDTIGPALQSVAWADERIVVDSGSTDGTQAVAEPLCDRFVVEPWRGYTAQKQFAASLATNPWVLVLDSDETCTPELAAELAGLDEDRLERFDVFHVRRRNYIFSRPVRSWWPDWQSRVIHRDRVRWPDEALHDARQATDPSREGRLEGCIEHKRHSAAGFEDYFGGRRLDARLLMVARQMHASGKQCHWWDLVLRPPLAFFKSYILKRGFLDGSFGLLIAQKQSVSTQLKYAALWTVQHGHATTPPSIPHTKTPHPKPAPSNQGPPSPR